VYIIHTSGDSGCERENGAGLGIHRRYARFRSENLVIEISYY
jgi:hypothetical protein